MCAQLKAREVTMTKCKSDEAIAQEFTDFTITSLEWDAKPGSHSGWIHLEFPNAGDHVGGGAIDICDRFIFYNKKEWLVDREGVSPSIAFTNWFPEEPVYRALVQAIVASIG